MKEIQRKSQSNREIVRFSGGDSKFFWVYTFAVQGGGVWCIWCLVVLGYVVKHSWTHSSCTRSIQKGGLPSSCLPVDASGGAAAEAGCADSPSGPAPAPGESSAPPAAASEGSASLPKAAAALAAPPSCWC